MLRVLPPPTKIASWLITTDSRFRGVREQRQVRRPALETAETGVETQAPRFRISARRADVAHPGPAPASLLEEVVDQQQVVEVRGQGHAAHGNNLLHHGAPRVRSITGTAAAFACLRGRIPQSGARRRAEEGPSGI